MYVKTLQGCVIQFEMFRTSLKCTFTVRLNDIKFQIVSALSNHPFPIRVWIRTGPRNRLISELQFDTLVQRHQKLWSKNWNVRKYSILWQLYILISNPKFQINMSNASGTRIWTRWFGFLQILKSAKVIFKHFWLTSSMTIFFRFINSSFQRANKFTAILED